MNEALVSVDWLAENSEDPQLVILDASMQGNVSGLTPEYPDLWISGARYFDLKGRFSDQNSHLPNTLPSPEDFTSAARDLGINDDSKIVIYDNIGIYSAPRAWWMFRSMGHQNVAVLDGGLSAWKNAGHATEKPEDAQHEKGNFVASFDPQKFRSADDVLDNVSWKNFVTIDARSAGRFAGTAPEPRKELKSGHIPDSVNLPYPEVLDGSFMKSKKKLLEIFARINPLAKPMTFSCGSGLTACIILLAAEVAGRKELSVYDGSWTDWAGRENFPIASEAK